MAAAEEKPVTLTGPDNWHEWLHFIRLKLDPMLWESIDPNGLATELLQRPYRPQYSEFNDTGSNKYVDLTEDQARAYGEAFGQWKILQEEYDAQLKEISKAQAVIRDSVDPTFEVLLHTAKDIQQWMAILKDAACPTSGYMCGKMMEKYLEVMKSYKGPSHFPTWLKVWQAIILTAANWHVPQTESGQWLRDISKIIETISQHHAAIFHEAAKDWDEEADRKRQNAQKALDFHAAHVTRAEVQARTASQGTMVHVNGHSRPAHNPIPIPALAPQGTATGLSWTYTKVAKTMQEWASRSKPGDMRPPDTKPAPAAKNQAQPQTNKANKPPPPAANKQANNQTNKNAQNKGSAPNKGPAANKGNTSSSIKGAAAAAATAQAESSAKADKDWEPRERGRGLERDNNNTWRPDASRDRESRDRESTWGEHFHPDRDPSRSREPPRKGVKRPNNEEPSPRAPKRPELMCSACGNVGHGLFSCWHLFEDRRPADYQPNPTYIRKARLTVENNPELREKVRKFMGSKYKPGD